MTALAILTLLSWLALAFALASNGGTVRGWPALTPAVISVALALVVLA